MPIKPIEVHSTGVTAAPLMSFPEAAGQTFLTGSPLRLVSGFVQECENANPWTAADIVIGFSTGPGQNLAVAGAEEEGASYASPFNQPLGKTIAPGTPYKTGQCLFEPTNAHKQFRISLQNGGTFSQALVVPNTYYALRKDASGAWYCDSTDTSGNNNVLQILGVDSTDNTVVICKIKASQSLEN